MQKFCAALSAVVFAMASTATPVSAVTWIEEAVLIPNEAPNPARRLGESISIHEDRIVIGDFLSSSLIGSGFAHVYTRSAPHQWAETTTLTADGDRRFFGSSVSVFGDLVAVSDPSTNFSVAPSLIHLFKLDGTGGATEVPLFGLPQFSAPDSLGASVGLYGSTLIAAAPSINSVSVIRRLTLSLDPLVDVWLGEANFQGPSASRQGSFRFGSTLSTNGDTVVIGGQFPSSSEVIGMAFLSERASDGIWSDLIQFQAPNPKPGDFFGISVAISGNYAIIGASGDDEQGSFSGAAYIYHRDGSGVWSLASRLTASTPHESAGFGQSVAISGDTVIVGSNGAAYIFQKDVLGVWSEVQLLENPSSSTISHFGKTVAISGNTAVVRGDQRVHVFVVPEPTALLLWMVVGLSSLGHRKGKNTPVRL